MKRDWFEPRSLEEREVMVKYAALARTMTILGLSGGCFSAIYLHAPLLFGIVPRTLTNLTDNPGSIFSVQSVYLYEISTPCRYYLTRISQIIGSCCTIPAYSGIDVLFGMIVLHSCGQMEILSKRIQNMAEKKSNNFQALLKLHIKNHYRQIRYSITFIEP